MTGPLIAGQAAAKIGEQFIIDPLVSIAEFRHFRLQARDRKLSREDILELPDLRLKVAQRLSPSAAASL